MHFKNDFSSPLQQRRTNVMKDIRNIQRQQIKQRARSLMINHLSKQQLLSFIESTKNSISYSQLAKLVKYVNDQYPKAIAHLGNLIIDQKINIKQLNNFTLKPGNHPYWLWLIQIFVQNSYFTISLFQFCIKSLAPDKKQNSNFRVLSILYKIIYSNLQAPVQLRDQNTLLKIINVSFCQDQSAKMSYLLMKQLIKRSQDRLNGIFKEGFIRNRFILSLKNGLLHNQNIYRHLTLQIIESLSNNKLYFHQLRLQIMKFIHQKTSIEFIQTILSFLSNFVMDNDANEILLILNDGLLIIFSRWKHIYSIIRICRQIKGKTRDLNLISNGIANQLQNLDLLGFKSTFEQQLRII